MPSQICVILRRREAPSRRTHDRRAATAFRPARQFLPSRCAYPPYAPAAHRRRGGRSGPKLFTPSSGLSGGHVGAPRGVWTAAFIASNRGLAGLLLLVVPQDGGRAV